METRMFFQNYSDLLVCEQEAVLQMWVLTEQFKEECLPYYDCLHLFPPSEGPLTNASENSFSNILSLMMSPELDDLIM